MPQNLLRRQRRIYTHRVDVYRKERQDSGGWAYRRVVEGLFCRLRATPNSDTGHSFGQQKSTNIFVLDHLRTSLDGDVQDDDKIRVTKCDGHVGEWYSIMGAPKATPGINNRVNTTDAMLNKTTPPEVIS